MAFLDRFRTDTRGNIAMMFGLTVMPVFMSMGMAVDYSRAVNARAELQVAVDSAAIAAARAATRMSDAELEIYGQDYFKANFAKPSFDLESFTIQRDDHAVTATGEGKLQTSLMALVPGYETLPVRAEARVGWKSSRLEVALVLDNTLSMNQQNRLQELKKASRNLIDILEQASYGKDTVKISVVPFNTQVRVDANQYRTAQWLRFNGIGQASWTGCLNERDQPFNVNAAPASIGNPASLHVAEDCDGNTASIIRLTDNYNQVRQAIDSMKAASYTNITLGATWGRNVLASDGPFGDGSQGGGSEDVKKFMILLTDGDNTQSRFHGRNTDPNSAAVKAMNVDTLAACATTKAAGIELYTVLLVSGDEVMLRDCASSPSKFRYVANAQDLDSVFQGIVQEMGGLRLTN